MTVNPRSLAKIKKLFYTAIMVSLSIVMLLPFLWMLSASFKHEGDIFQFPIQWIPGPATLDNYRTVWASSIPFTMFYWNSLKVSVICVLGEVFTSALAAYAFSKINFKGRELAFMLYVATLIFPSQMLLVPRFLLFRAMGIYNTHWALILPGMFTAFGTFLLRQFFLTLPDELAESARLDGCGHPMIFLRIILPLSMPSISALVIFTFVSTWNAYDGPLVYLASKELFTIPLGLVFFQDEHRTSYAAIMAASVCSLLPIIAIFLAAQKHFIEGIAITGMKA